MSVGNMSSKPPAGSDSNQKKDRGHLKPVPDPAPANVIHKPKYRADEFILPAHDEKGQSVPYSYRGDKRYGAIMSEIIWSRKFPYKTPGDIQRHAMDRHLKFLDQLEPELISSDIAQLDIINENTRQGENALAFAHSIDGMEKTVNHLISAKLRGMAVKMVYENRKEAHKIENPLLRELYLSEIKTRFGHLFTSSHSVDLSQVSESAGSESEEEMHRTWGYSAVDEEVVIEHSVGAGDDDQSES